MRPILFELPLLGEIPSYPALFMLGFLACLALGRRDGERLGLQGQDIVDVGIVALLFGIAGARLLAVLFDGDLGDFVNLCLSPEDVPAKDAFMSVCAADADCGFDYLCDADAGRCHPPRDCLAALKFWRGGMTFYGGILFAVPGALWLARRRGIEPATMADLGAPLLMLGLAFGKVGCFLGGCCHGAPTGSPLAVSFPGVAGPVHPAQLYEAAAALSIFLLLRFAIRPRARAPGALFAWLLLLYGGARLFLELFRGDTRGSLGPLSTSQILSIPLLLLGLWLLLRLRRRPPA